MVYFKGNKPTLTFLEQMMNYDYLWCGSSTGWVLIDKFGSPINK